uniref:Uncharacterized protein n=1 Tax=Trypanosoma congolense (strain IL3000) TaxID=1068625 RepID=G0UTD3_TRYCI|nr:conserved hypothetical protein [Trypanosoma congolense IL3000]
MSKCAVTALCIIPDTDPVVLFVGRQDGIVEYYHFSEAAVGGKAIMTYYGHTKAVTGIVAPSIDQVYTCSMDGCVRQWSADNEQGESRRCLRLIKILTPLRCLALCNSRLYAGDENGCLQVILGETRATWPGHRDVLSCIACISEEDQLLVTGGYDNQIRLWDVKLGKTVRLLVGHTNHVKCLRVVAEGKLLLSFSRDLTMKIWRLPDSGKLDESEVLYISGLLGRQATVSFKEPGADNKVDVLEQSQGESDGGAQTAAEGEEYDTDEGVQGIASGGYKKRADDRSTSRLKSALKERPEPPIQRIDAVGTIEIPMAPHTVAAREEGSTYCFVGSSEGYVFGIDARSLSKTILYFLAQNATNLRTDNREMRRTLLLAKRAIFSQCRKNIGQKKMELIKAAKKMRAAKRVEEKKEREAARAAARLERLAREAEEAESEVDVEEDEADDETGDEEEFEEEESDKEEFEEDENDDLLAILDDQQREELSEFTKKCEEARTDDFFEIQQAVEKRGEVLRQVTATTYDMPREKFFRLNFTSYKKIGDEPVFAIVIGPNGSAIAAQAEHLLSVDVTPGVTYL